MREQGREKEYAEIPPQIPDFIEKAIKDPDIFNVVKDERNGAGNGYVEVLIETTAPQKDGFKHRIKVGYEVTDKPGGTPGKRWQKWNEEDWGRIPDSETIH